MPEADGSEPTSTKEKAPSASAPSVSSSGLSAPLSLPALTTDTAEGNSRSEEPHGAVVPETNKPTPTDSRVLAESGPSGKAAERRENDAPTADSVLKLFDRLNPRDQLNRVMLAVGMPGDHWPPETLELARRQTKIVEWATNAGPDVLAKLDSALKNLIPGELGNHGKRKPHPNAPKASMRDATSELRKDRDSDRSRLENLVLT